MKSIKPCVWVLLFSFLFASQATSVYAAKKEPAKSTVRLEEEDKMMVYETKDPAYSERALSQIQQMMPLAQEQGRKMGLKAH